mmetsp:Transcript_26207/g.63696  ORF Transcript_26207/g.63696 Transcript_26207/m.63696 type:complete len:308 (+) Transcript_26207:276-1199(+)
MVGVVETQTDWDRFEVDIQPKLGVFCSIRNVPGETGVAPLAVLFGWLGSKREHVRKYALLYERMGYSTVVVIAPLTAIFAVGYQPQREIAEAVLRLIAEHPKVSQAFKNNAGIVLHPFSNGGAFIVRWMYNLVVDSNFVARTDSSWTEKFRNGDAVAGVVYDSCPVALEPYLAIRAILGGKKNPNPLSHLLVALVFYVYMAVFWIFHGVPAEPYLRDMEALDFGPELYIYSDADDVMDEQTEKFVQRKMSLRNNGAQLIRELHFKDSAHVAHLRKHPEKYKDAIVSVNNSWVVPFRERSKSSTWAKY